MKTNELWNRKNCNDYSGFVSLNVEMNAIKFIFKMNGTEIGIQELQEKLT